MSPQASSTMAPILYLYSMGVLLFFVVGAVLIYRVSLLSWVRAAREPFWLRLLVIWAMIGSYLMVTWLWFWGPLFPWTWGYDPILEWPLVFWIVLLIWVISLLIVLTIARRSRYAS